MEARLAEFTASGESPRAAPARKREFPRLILPLAALSAAYFVLAGVHLNRHVDPTRMDTTAYLDVACDISENGGLPGLLWRCVSGTYLEANRHPLYMLLLSPLAERDLSFFVRAKILTVIIGWAAVLATWWTLRRAFGEAVALLGAALLVTNTAFLEMTTMVASESLLTICFVLAWGSITREGRQRRHAALGGMWIALAYLTKTSGLLLLPSYVLSLLIMRKESRRGRLIHAACLLLMFVVVSSPLLIRNARVYRNPWYNVNSAAFWLDSWEDFYRPEFRTSPPSALRYVEAHGPGQTAGRLLHGIGAEAELLCEKGLAVRGLGRIAGGVVAILILAVAGYGLYRDDSSWRRWFSLVLFLLAFLAFAWYFPVVGHERFMLPLVPMICGYAAGGTLAGIPAVWKRLRKNAPSRNIVECWTVRLVSGALILCAVVSAAVSRDLRRNPFRAVRLAQGYFDLAERLETTLPRDAVYLMGPNHRFDFHWHRRLPGRRLEVPELDDFAALQAFIRRERVTHVVLDIEVVYRRREALGAFFALDRKRGIVMRRLPPGWTLLFADGVGRVDYAVFAVAP